MKKKEMEERIASLEAVVQQQNESLVNNKIREHRDGYIHIPFSWGGLGRMLLAWGSLLLVLVNTWATFVFFWNRFNVGEVFKPVSVMVTNNISPDMLFFLYPLFFWFFSVWLCAFCMKFWVDGNWDDMGGLVVVLVVVLVFGLVGGLVFGLVGGLVFGLVVGLVFGLVVGLVVGFLEIL